jgi:hypothetical protein
MFLLLKSKFISSFRAATRLDYTSLTVVPRETLLRLKQIDFTVPRGTTLIFHFPERINNSSLLPCPCIRNNARHREPLLFVFPLQRHFEIRRVFLNTFHRNKISHEFFPNV